ncbi:7-cyano-7-deazaguanine synthase, partial [bacterium]|nr:7-cyano-7-deazaguanine synthase [bacterium]
MKIAVALSGGVDSAAVALRLKQAGHEVIGITLDFCQEGKSTAGLKIAQRLGIRHEQLSPVAEFNRLVIKPFVRAFTAGLTPNTCAFCNR